MKQKNIITAIIIILLYIFQEVCFINIIGNSYINGLDNQLASCNIEHWYLWLKGSDQFFTTNQFYPIKNNVGILDMMMVFSPFYILARLFCGHSLSYLISVSGVHAVGTAGIYYLNRKVFGFSLSATVIAMFLFSFSNNLQVQMVHIYLLSISLAPWIIAFIIKFLWTVISGRTKFKYLVVAIGLFALLCYSSVYVAQFLMFFAGLTMIIFLVHSSGNHKIKCGFAVFVQSIKQNLIGYILSMLFAVVIMLPFVYAYFPILKEAGGYNAQEQLFYSPLISDLFNVGPDNFLYGEVIEQLGIHQGAFTVGFPIVTFLFLLVIIYSSVTYVSNNRNNVLAVLCKSCAMSICVTVLIITNIDEKFNLWSLIRCLIPGMSSMRAMSRFILFLLFPLSFICCAFLHNVFCRIKCRTVKRRLLVILALFFVVENINKSGVIDIEWEKVIKDINVADMPENCKAFFVFDSQITEEEKLDGITQNYMANDLAFRIANNKGIRTLNGIGSVFPFGTYELFNIYGEGYLDAIVEWVLNYNLKGVYGYDVETDTWSLLEDVVEKVSYRMHKGFSVKEENGADTWYWAIDHNSMVHIYNLSERKRNLEFSFTTAVAPDGSADKIDIYRNDQFVMSTIEGKDVCLEVEIGANEKVEIKIQSYGELCSIENDDRVFAYMLKNPKLIMK